MRRQGTFGTILAALQATAAGLLIFLLSWPMPAHSGERAVKRDQEASIAVSFSERGATRKGDLYALVVGVSKYASAGIPHLNLAAKDAKDFAQFIKGQKEFFNEIHLQFLTDEQASRAKIEKFLLYEVRRATKDDAVILYFSGHGSIDPMRADDFYFLSHDSDPEIPAATAVLMNGPRFFHKLAARQVLVVLDACHAGNFSNIQTRSTGEALRSYIQQVGQSSGQVIISSSSPSEYSQEVPDLPNGVFTHYLLDGLAGKADRDSDGVVTVKEAYDYAFEQTRKRTGGAQNPMFEGRVTGQFPVSFLKPQGTLLELTTEPGEVSVHVRDKTSPKFRFLNKTDAAGRLVIKDLPVGEDILFRLSKDGWQDMVLDPIILSPDKREVKYPTVRMTPRQGHLTVMLNAPKVTVRLDNMVRGETDEGNFLFIEEVQVGVPHELILSKDGFKEKKITFTIPLSQEGHVHQLRETLAALPKPEPKPVEVTVLTAPGLVDVFMGDSKTPAGQTDSSGKLKLQLKGPRDVVLVFRKPGHTMKQKELSLPPEGAVSVERVSLARIEPTLELVVDQPGARVFVKHRQKAVKREDAYEFAGTTDERGHLTVKNLPLGSSVYLKVQKAGWKDQYLGPFELTEDRWLLTVDIALEPDQPREERIAKPEPVKPPPPAESREAPKPPTTELLVYTSPGEVGVIIDGEFKGESSPKGDLRVKGLPVDKTVKVVFKKHGFLPAEKSVKLAAVVTTRLDAVVLNRLLTKLETSVDQPFADVLVRHSGNFTPAGRTDRNGKAVIDDLPLDRQIYVKIKKEGWREAILGPVTLTEELPHAALPAASLEMALAKSLKIQTDPSGVSVKIDGVAKKPAPTGGVATVPDVQVGVDLEVELHKPGYQAKHLSLKVPVDKEGRDYRYEPSIKLDRAMAKLEFKTLQPDVAVKLDGKMVQRTGPDGGGILERMPVGVAFRFEFEKEGYKRRSLDVTIPLEYEGGTFNPKPGEMVSLEAEPKPAPRVADKPTPSSEGTTRQAEPRRAEPQRVEPREVSPFSAGESHRNQGGSDFSGGARFPSDFR